MAAGFPDVPAGNMGSEEHVVIPPEVLIAPEVLNDLADNAPLGVPQDKPWADFFMYGKKVQILAQTPVIPFLGFFQAIHVFF